MTATESHSPTLKCSQCSKKFKYESEKQRHELSHSPQFQCGSCTKKFSFLSALRRHEKQHVRTGSVSCTECKKKFRDEILLKRHMNYAHKGTYVCKKCSSIFKSQVALQMHMKTHRPVSERKYPCSFDGCKKSFNFAHHLKHHELTHTNKKQYFCNVCGKGFIQLHHLKTHIKTHNSENWVTCTVSNCNKRFSTEYAMKRHSATHENVSGNQFIDRSKSVRCPLVKLKKSVKDPVKDNKNAPKSVGTEKDPTIPLDSNNDKVQSDVFNKTLNNIDIVTDCEIVLGGCLISGNPKDDCLCVQMTHNNDEPYDLTPIAKRKDISTLNTTSDKKQCEGCECAAICNITNIDNENSCNPNIEYGVDGIVKLRDTFDIDIPESIVNHKEIEFKESKIKSVPYNSCKAILGKCIVSGSGTISENCLCAKMHCDESQVLSEEAEGIIPHPNDSQLGHNWDNETCENIF